MKVGKVSNSQRETGKYEKRGKARKARVERESALLSGKANIGPMLAKFRIGGSQCVVAAIGGN